MIRRSSDRPFRFQCASAIWLLVAAAQARAGIIIDDFVDPAETVSPEMQGEDVVTDSVGFLHGRRTMSLGGLQSKPVARLTVDDAQSQLVGEIGDLNPSSNAQTPSWGMLLDYDFDTTDISQGGVNNAIFVDIKSFQADILPHNTVIFLQADNGSFESLRTTVPPGEDPYSLVFPFDSFQTRGGGSSAPNFSRVTSITWSLGNFIRMSNSTQVDLGFLLQVERIRIGKIPEPSAVALLLFGIAAAPIFRRRWFRVITQCHRKEN